MMTTDAKPQATPLRVALVNPLGVNLPRATVPPLGLGALIKYYEVYGQHPGQVEFRIFDEHAGRNIPQQIAQWGPQLIGITAMSPLSERALSVASRLRVSCPSAFIICGGVHFHVFPFAGLGGDAIDATCVGEGEETLRSLIDLFILGGRRPEVLGQIPNLAYKDEGGAPRQTVRWCFDNLKQMPLPDVERFDLSYYFAKRQFLVGVYVKSAPVLSSRGCPFKCAFCFNSFHSGGVRYHDIDTVVDYMIQIRSRHGVRHFYIWDDIFVMTRERVQHFCARLMSEAPDLRWVCMVRPSILRDDDLPLLNTMRKAGCLQFNMGLESGSDEILARVKGKDCSVAKNQRAVDLAFKAGIPVFGYFLCGIPGETEDQMEMTGAFIRRNLSKMRHLEVFLWSPIPGAELTNQAQAEGLIADMSSEEVMLNLTAQGEASIYNKNVPAEKIIRFRQSIKHEVMSRYSWRQKLRWMLIEGLDNPFSLFLRIRALYFPQKKKVA